MADLIKITYSAEGRLNGRKATLYDVCGRTFDEIVVDAARWRQCDTPSEQRNFLLNIARREYPEVDWEYAQYSNITSA